MITAPTGVLMPAVTPGSPEWLTRMSASKIAAVLGLSPYESRFSLWHHMAGLIKPDEQTDVMARGHYLEPAIAAWFADEHPTWQVSTTGTFVAADADWQAATPDRLVVCDTGEVRLLQCKSDAEPDNYGTPGTDEIPVYYRAQVQWEMHVTGVPICHLAVITRYLEFREYVVHYDADECAYMVGQAAEFMASLPSGARPRRPDLDDHSATYQVVRELHADTPGGDFDVPLPMAQRFCAAVARLKTAKATEQSARTELADAMGDAKRAVLGESTIARRDCKPGGVPYLVAARKLPDLPSDQEAA